MPLGARNDGMAESLASTERRPRAEPDAQAQPGSDSGAGRSLQEATTLPVSCDIATSMHEKKRRVTSTRAFFVIPPSTGM